MRRTSSTGVARFEARRDGYWDVQDVRRRRMPGTTPWMVAVLPRYRRRTV